VGTVLVKIEILMSVVGNLLNILHRNDEEQHRKCRTIGKQNPIRIQT